MAKSLLAQCVIYKNTAGQASLFGGFGNISWEDLGSRLSWLFVHNTMSFVITVRESNFFYKILRFIGLLC